MLIDDIFNVEMSQLCHQFFWGAYYKQYIFIFPFVYMITFSELTFAKLDANIT